MSMKVPVEIPSGLIRPKQDKKMTVENAELKIALQQAADNADLNLTERLAINKKFFPDGDGFDTTPKYDDILEITTYYKKDSDEKDNFNEEALELALRTTDGVVKDTHRQSSKSSFQTNLENALKKLAKVVQDW
ncbi:MAG: hypothetical protein E7Z90_03820 [Cyanobacteria bacterium SIG29]|nr:hypothetical protein [Cyanobacteria bacterium SIG29]